MMTVWSGLENGIPTADMNPGQLAPTSDDQLQWPLWGLHYMSSGFKGQPPEIPEALKLVELLGAWRKTTTAEQRVQIWTDMLNIYSEEVFSIGIVNASLQPILHASRLRNVPEKGLYGFDPTAFMGVYMPDTFWFAEEA